MSTAPDTNANLWAGERPLSYATTTIVTTAASSVKIDFSPPHGDHRAAGYHPPTRDLKSAAGTSTRNAFRAILRACHEALVRMENSEDDYVHRANAFRHFEGCLGDLWDLRHEFSDAYSEIINMLQGLVSQRAIESFDAKEIELLKVVTDQLLTVEEIDDDFASEVTSLLLRGGIDVFREID